MKHISNITIISLITLVSLAGCTSTGEVTPSQNKELNAVSPTTSNKKAGYMQNALDSWLKDDWEATIEKDPEIQKKYMKKEGKEEKYTENRERSFTLQEYVDKAVAYQKGKPNDHNASHAKEMEALPVIGK